jgi:hypothetical protein
MIHLQVVHNLLIAKSLILAVWQSLYSVNQFLQSHLLVFHYMDSHDEQNRRKNTEKINFAIQGMAENAQFTIARAVGVFGILTLFVMINHHDMGQYQKLKWGNSVWTKGLWTAIYGTILSIAYWALILFRFNSYITRRLFEALAGYYQKTTHEEWHDDVKRIAGENKLTNVMVEKIWASNYNKESRYKGIWFVIIPYFVITALLWIFVTFF